MGGEGVVVCQVGSADRAGGVILSGGERWLIQTVQKQTEACQRKARLVMSQQLALNQTH